MYVPSYPPSLPPSLVATERSFAPAYLSRCILQSVTPLLPSSLPLLPSSPPSFPQYSIQNVTRLGELGACRLVATAMRTFIGDRCIQLLGLEAIEALAAKSEGARANFEQVRSSLPSMSLHLWSISVIFFPLNPKKPSHSLSSSSLPPSLPFTHNRRQRRSCLGASSSCTPTTRTCKQLPAR